VTLIAKTEVKRTRKPDLIPGYRLEGVLGVGGMGEVYKATQLSLGRVVAVKLLSDELAKDTSFVARFEKEGAALAALSHPNIVSVVDRGSVGGATYYLVMEFVDGMSLREFDRQPDLTTAAKLRVVYDVCRAMEYAHGRGIVHRDLKPENILFDAQAGGVPKVSDFGLAGFLEGEATKFDLTQQHVGMGTLSYMAPEQRTNAKEADHRADIFSLGVILYELATGEVPVGNFDPPSAKKEGTDKRLDLIVARCLNARPDDRYQAVSELLADLEPLFATESIRPRKLGRAERARLAFKAGARRILRASAALAVVAALGILAGNLARPYRHSSWVGSIAERLAAVGSPAGNFSMAVRREDSALVHTFKLAAGQDSLAARWHGARPAFNSPSTVQLVNSDGEGSGALVALQLDDVGADGLRWTGELARPTGKTSGWSRVRRAVLGESEVAAGTLMLWGPKGHFAAVSTFSDGSPPRFEYRVGDKAASVQLLREGPPGVAGGVALSLSIDHDGNLGAEANGQRIGEVVALGPNWEHAFGGAPRPAVGCLEGACQFKGLVYEAFRRKPKEPEVASATPTAPAPPPSLPSKTKIARSAPAAKIATKPKSRR
jgi:hypothetical protein